MLVSLSNKGANGMRVTPLPAIALCTVAIILTVQPSAAVAQCQVLACADDDVACLQAQLEAFDEPECLTQTRSILAMPGLDIILEGTAEFLRERAEAEIEFYAVEKLRGDLCATTATPPIRPLLETTCILVESFTDDRDSRGSRVRMESIVAALRADFELLSARLLRLVATHLTNDRRARLLLETFSQLIQSLSSRIEPVNVARNISDAIGQFECGGDADCIGYRSSLLRVSTLLYAALRGARLSEDQLRDILLPQGEDYPANLTARDAERSWGRLVDTASGVTRLATELQEGSLSADARITAAVSLVDQLLAATFDAAALARQARGIAVNDDGYSQAISSLRAIIRAHRDGEYAMLLSHALRLADTCLLLGGANDEQLERFRREIGSALRVLSSAAALASARTSDEVRGVLDSIAAPVGSYRTKRAPRHVFSLTGLVGFGIGYERTFADETEFHAGALSLHASIGLDWSMHGGMLGSIGLYLHLIDLGALASAPFGLEVPGGPQEREVRVEVDGLSWVSPGLYIRWGIADSPAVLAIGAAYVPRARTLVTEVPMGDDVQQRLDGVRIQLILGVDATLWVFN